MDVDNIDDVDNNSNAKMKESVNEGDNKNTNEKININTNESQNTSDKKEKDAIQKDKTSEEEKNNGSNDSDNGILNGVKSFMENLASFNGLPVRNANIIPSIK